MWSAYSQIVLAVTVGDAPSHCHWVCGYDFKAKSTFMSLQLTDQQLMKPTRYSHTRQPISSVHCAFTSRYSLGWSRNFLLLRTAEVHYSVHMLLELGVSSSHLVVHWFRVLFNPLKPELNPICYLLALLGAHHFLHVSRIRVKLLTFRLLMSYIYGAPILDVSRSHTTT